MNRIGFFVALILTMALSACGSNAVKLGDDAQGQTVEMKVGQKLVLSLDGNPTTGYAWEVVEIDPNILELQGEPDYKSGSGLIGSGGVFTYTMTALQPGESNLKLFYLRSWEEDIPPLKEFAVTIIVK